MTIAVAAVVAVVAAVVAAVVVAAAVNLVPCLIHLHYHPQSNSYGVTISKVTVIPISYL